MIAILDPFSGISGDMTLGALVDAGLPEAWLAALPDRLGLVGVSVRVSRVQRAGLTATKVDFEIPQEPHGRHLSDVRRIVQGAGLPREVSRRCDAVFEAIAEVEAEAHGVSPEDVHFHEVGAVDAILDVVGAVWGLQELGVQRVYCGPVSLGDGFVRAAHGVLPVPAPATLRLLSGHRVRPGPEGAGELVTPTGAALVRVLSEGPPPASWVPRRAGLGAGTKDFVDRANVLRVILADGAAEREGLVMLACDLDDMTPEAVSAAAAALLGAGALDVVTIPLQMKKGRVGVRLEVLASSGDVSRLEERLFLHTTTLGVRQFDVSRRALVREEVVVQVLGAPVRVKVATLPNGSRRAKPEFDDVSAVAQQHGCSVGEVAALAMAAWNGSR